MTTKVGSSEALCICHQDNLYTFVLRYPRMIHSEFMTHRVFSRNASSSRAIPVAKVIEQVRNDPFIPSHVYMNQSGMVGTVEASEDTYESFKGLWLKAVDNAVAVAESMVALGVHK